MNIIQISKFTDSNLHFLMQLLPSTLMAGTNTLDLKKKSSNEFCKNEKYYFIFLRCTQKIGTYFQNF